MIPNPSELERQTPQLVDDLTLFMERYYLTNDTLDGWANGCRMDGAGAKSEVAYLIRELRKSRAELRKTHREQFQKYMQEVAEHGKESGVTYNPDGKFIEAWWSQDQTYVERIQGTRQIELCRSVETKEIIGVKIHGINLWVSMAEIRQEG